MVRTILARGGNPGGAQHHGEGDPPPPRRAPAPAPGGRPPLFARQDYRSTTTKEISEAAGVAEHLLFRNFGSKAALFNEAVVVPFLQIIDGFSARWELLVARNESAEAVNRGSSASSMTCSWRIVGSS